MCSLIGCNPVGFHLLHQEALKFEHSFADFLELFLDGSLKLFLLQPFLHIKANNFLYIYGTHDLSPSF